MLFHAGAGMWLSEVGLLGQLDQILSVSGGSITASVLGLGWSKLKFDGSGRASNLSEVVIAPIRTLAARTIDVGSVLSGVFGMGTVAGKIADRYRKYLFGVATLQDLPDHPRFVINATNVQSNRSGGFRNRTCGIGEWARPETQRLNSLLPSAVHLPFRQFSPRWSWI